MYTPHLTRLPSCAYSPSTLSEFSRPTLHFHWVKTASRRRQTPPRRHTSISLKPVRLTKRYLPFSRAGFSTYLSLEGSLTMTGIERFVYSANALFLTKS